MRQNNLHNHETISLKASQKKMMATILAKAFMDDPVYGRIFPDEEARRINLERLFAAVVAYAHRYGRVDTTSALEGAACWLSPGNTEVTFWRMLRAGLGLQRAVMRMDSDSRRLLLDALGHLDAIHNQLVDGPHWYLWALGVDPAVQGKGTGGRLLQPVLALSERDGLPIYLETQTERNLVFYERWGFEVRNEERLPDLDLKVWAMIRS